MCLRFLLEDVSPDFSRSWVRLPVDSDLRPSFVERGCENSSELVFVRSSAGFLLKASSSAVEASFVTCK